MVRHLLYAAFVHPYFQALQKSSDTRLAEIAAKAVKEMAYHVRHASEWVIRLGDGTEESHARAQGALDDLWMYTGEMFDLSDGERMLVQNGAAPDRAAIKPAWDSDHRSRARRGNAEAPTRSAGCKPAAAPAGTANTWVAFSPRCR